MTLSRNKTKLPVWLEPSPFVETRPLTFLERWETPISTVCFILFLAFCVYGLPVLLAGMDLKVCPVIDNQVRCDR